MERGLYKTGILPGAIEIAPQTPRRAESVYILFEPFLAAPGCNSVTLAEFKERRSS